MNWTKAAVTTLAFTLAAGMASPGIAKDKSTVRQAVEATINRHSPPGRLS